MSHKRKFNEDLEEINSDEYFECKYCSYGTSNIDELDEHIQNHEDSLSIVEEEEKLKKIEEEIEDKKNEVKYEIEQYEHSKKISKRRAKNVSSSGGWYKCGLCLYKTKRKHDLPKHFITHCTLQTTTVYRCSECNYETKRKNDMPKHMLGHCSGNVPMYKCSECPYQTKRKNDLPKHLLCHKPPETVALWYCAHCSYCTKRKGDLHKHELNHLSRDQLEEHHCTECKYVTKRKNDLHKHMLVHSDRHIEGYFKCLKCSYATDKVHKFSKHALSQCTYWQESKNIDRMNLEDILADADNEGIHVVLDDDEDRCFIELEEDEFQESQDGVENDQEGEEGGEEVYEVIDDSYDESNGEHVTYKNQYENENVTHYEPIININQEKNNTKKAIFNLNLGEFTVDDDVTPNPDEFSNVEDHR